MPERRLLFARWDFPPEPDEPAHGYYLRLVKAEGMVSVTTFNIWNDVEHDRAEPQLALRLLKRHPIPADWMERLVWASATKRGMSIHLAGQRFANGHLSYSSRRWCPGCLGEKAYHRCWWDIVAIRTCPFHGCDLVDRDMEDAKVSWKWPDFEESRAGVPLGRSMERTSEETFAGYALGRMGFASAKSAPVLDAVTLGDAITICEIVGKLVSNPPMETVPDVRIGDIDIGYRLLARGWAEVAEAFRAWLRANVPADNLRGSLWDAFGWIAGTAWAVKINARVRYFLRRAMFEARGFEERKSHARIVDDDFTAEYVSLKALAAQLEMEPKAITMIAEELRIPARSRRGVTVGDSGAITKFADALLTPAQTAEMLGIHTDALRHLVHAGHLKVFRGLDLGQRNGARFDKGRVDKILQAIDALPFTGAVEYGVTFNIHRKRENLVYGELAVDILAGRVAVAEKRPDVPGFSGLMIQTGKPRKRADFGRTEDLVSMKEAQAILNLSNVTVAALLKPGTLGEVKRMPRFVLLRRDEVVDFGLRHAKIADFSRTLGLHPTIIHKRLMAAGVDLVVRYNGNDTGPRLESVVAKEDVMRVFGIAKDPTVLHDDKFNGFWTRLVGHARQHCPYVYFPDRLPAEGQRVWQSAGIFSAVFRFDVDDYVLDVMLVPAGGNRQSLRLAITDDDQDIVDLMLLMTRTIDGALAAAADKKRAAYVAKGPPARDGRGRIKPSEGRSQ